MSAKQDPAFAFNRITSFPHTKPIRKIWVLSGDIVVKNDLGETVTIVEAELAAINNQAINLTEVTSSTLGVVYVSQ